MSISKKLVACFLSICPLLGYAQETSTIPVQSLADPTATLTDEFCNNTVSSWNQVISATPITGATSYKFNVLDAATGVFEELITTAPSFSLNQLTIALVPGHELSISVAYRVGKKWYPYGKSCKVKPTFIEMPCGFDPILNNGLGQPGNQAIWEEHIAEVIAAKENLAFTKAPYIYTIPVVFHIVDDGSATGVDIVTNAEVLTQLDLLNKAFENLLSSSNPNAADVQIRFCLAKQIVDGINPPSTNWAPYWTGDLAGQTITHGITRTTSAISNAHQIDDNPGNPNGMVALSNHISFPYDKYLNIWVVNSITDPSISSSILGYSPYPIASLSTYLTPGQQGLLDGVVLRADGFLGGSHATMNTGKVLVHEVGHYLKLYHTWTQACHAPASCATMGDFCCDTPTQYQPDWNGCTSGLNTCDPAVDPIDNHMSYSQEFCRNTFTQDQKEWMFACISLYRQNLVSNENHALTVPDCMNPLLLTSIFTTTSDQICAGGTVTFAATPVPALGTFIWSFPGGTPSTSTATSPTVTYPTAGFYDASISVTVGPDNAVATEQQMVFVANCNPLASNNGNWYYGDDVGITFASGMGQNTTYFPYPSTAPNNIQTNEAATSFSDDLGNLVFYTNGNTIYNKLHAVMNGHVAGAVDGKDNTSTNEGSAHRGVICFEDPNNVNTPGSTGYYIFHTSEAENMLFTPPVNHGLGFSHVTVNSTFPNGTVDAINVRPAQNYAISECVAAVSHCNGRDYWVVVQGTSKHLPMLQNPGPLYSTQQNRFFAYLVSPTGLAAAPVSSLKAPTAASNAQVFTTYKFSPDGNVFACLTQDVDNTYNVFFYAFDKSSGALTYLSKFNVPYTSNQYQKYTDLEFSPDGKVLYVITDIGLYQADISNVLSAPATFNYTYTNLGGVIHHSMALGPDGRIYLTGNTTTTKVSVINFPNTFNSSSWSNECALNLSGLTYDTGFKRNFFAIQNNARVIDSSTGGFVATQQNCTEFDFIPNLCGSHYSWNFAGLGTSTAYMPTFNFPGEGSYLVTLNVDGNISSQTIVIDIPDAAIIGNTHIECDAINPTDFFASPTGAYTYQWTVTGGLPATSNMNFISFVLVNPTANIQLTVTDPETGCSATTDVDIITDCCTSGSPITHPFKMSSVAPGRSFGMDVELDPANGFTYYAGYYSLDMSLGVHTVSSVTDVENFAVQLSEENCVNWMQSYPVYVSTLTSSSPVSTYYARPVKLRKTSTGAIFMASQRYGQSYIASIDPVTGNETIIFKLFDNTNVNTKNAIITDFVIDEANSRIVFLATLNGTALNFAPVFTGAPTTKVFVGAINYAGTPVAHKFLTFGVNSTSGTTTLALNNLTGDFYATIQNGLDKSLVYKLSPALIQASTPLINLVATTNVIPTDMEYSSATNQLSMIGLQKGGTTSPLSIIGSPTQYSAFLLSFNVGTSTPYMKGLLQSYVGSNPGLEIVSGEVVYQYSDVPNTQVVYGKWNPVTAANVTLNTADFVGSANVFGNAIDYNATTGKLFATGYFSPGVDFGGTILTANGAPSSTAVTFFASKLTLAGGYVAMGLGDNSESDAGENIGDHSDFTTITETSDESQLFEIYPNPTNGTFNIVFSNAIGESGTLIIQDIRGAIIFRQELTFNDGTFVFDADQLNMSAGMYAVSLITEASEFRKKLIIN